MVTLGTEIKPPESQTNFMCLQDCCREETVMGTLENPYGSATLTTSFPLTRPVFNFS